MCSVVLSDVIVVVSMCLYVTMYGVSMEGENANSLL